MLLQVFFKEHSGGKSLLPVTWLKRVTGELNIYCFTNNASADSL
jgi:hypothetical protein